MAQSFSICEIKGAKNLADAGRFFSIISKL
jgi:hypothetical protein